MIKPDYIFESSWEVCNKVGGIYTVLASKAYTLKQQFHDNIIFIGPDTCSTNPVDFEEDDALFKDWKSAVPAGLKVKTGRWLTPGKPIALLLDFKQLFDARNSLYYEMWDCYGVNSSSAFGDYDESCIFAFSTGLAIESFVRYYKIENQRLVAVFNEWTLGMGALWLQKHLPEAATMFVTHATTIGRSIACNNKPLYSHLDAYDGDRMAEELHVEAKHSLEKQTAKHVDCFATVSDITALECVKLLDRKPDIVTPNGFETVFVPKDKEYDRQRSDARKTLADITAKLTGYPVADDAFFVATSGRYEYRNKGIDIFIDTINRLRTTALSREIVAFIMIPAWVYAPRADLKYLIDNDITDAKPLQTPFITHYLNNMSDDRIINFILSSGFTNTAADRTRIIFVPCYLNGRDQIFNRPYYDLLTGMDATVFASYYEPWGYTPLESVTFGVPTVTTNLAGFGLWAKTQISGTDIRQGVAVVERTDDNYFDVVKNVSHHLTVMMTSGNTDIIRQNCFKVANKAEWSKFIAYYNEAFDIALVNAQKRTENNNMIKR
ncbi:MAG: glycosyl transferase [Tannerella sp.]|jgi:hypothetical protein|nr:glycosyl transferase [Tannerella sp.]